MIARKRYRPSSPGLELIPKVRIDREIESLSILVAFLNGSAARCGDSAGSGRRRWARQ